MTRRFPWIPLTLATALGAVVVAFAGPAERAPRTGETHIEAPPTVKLDLDGGVKLDMAFILAQGKSFWMGSPRNEERRYPNEEQHEVGFSRNFYLGVTTVTQVQWLAVMGGKNPSWFCKDGKGAEKVQGLNTDDFPVESVSWDEAKAFCEKLQAKLNDGYEYRLPTEAEWEYACRGGDTSKNSLPFYLKRGATASLSGGQINFDGNLPYGLGEKGAFLGRTAKVGSYPDAVNAFGLYDMQGNVFQWCDDWEGEYPKEKAFDPTGPTQGDYRVTRGGSWNYFGNVSRAAMRGRIPPSNRIEWLGFRLVRVAVRCAR